MNRNKGGMFSHLKQDRKINYSGWEKKVQKRYEPVTQQNEENREGQPSLPVLKDKRALYENTR